jgi:hypothetical protein
MHGRALLTTASFVALAACTTIDQPTSHDLFMTNLGTFCGKSLEGRLANGDATDKDFASSRLIMGPVRCEMNEISIPFAVGENRTRTWVITRTSDGVRLKHVHRHADGHEDTVSRYGGDTAAPGTATRQEFPVDQFSKELFLANKLERSVTNTWAVEAVPGKLFAYELRRANRFFRVEFDDASAATPK